PAAAGPPSQSIRQALDGPGGAADGPRSRKGTTPAPSAPARSFAGAFRSQPDSPGRTARSGGEHFAGPIRSPALVSPESAPRTAAPVPAGPALPNSGACSDGPRGARGPVPLPSTGVPRPRSAAPAAAPAAPTRRRRRRGSGGPPGAG